MAENTKIEWVDHTFNPWIGCTRISAACDNCYAASMSHRRGWARFEAGAARKRTTAAYWRQPHLWNKKAAAAGKRAKVFGPSLADPYDAEIGDDWRDDFMEEIEATPDLDWLLLTKRPQVAQKYHRRRRLPPNVGLGVTAENQAMADLRIPRLLATPAAMRFISAEPLLGPVDLTHLTRYGEDRTAYIDNALDGFRAHKCGGSYGAKLDWVIAGGESGRTARPMHPDWARSLRDQCAAAGVRFFMKQMTKKAPIPDDLMIREFPDVA